MTTTVAGVYRFEWYALAPACTVGETEKSQYLPSRRRGAKNPQRASHGALTSQPGTSFMISFSRASAACSLRKTSRSDSARRSGTRWIRDHAFSRCSSLWVEATVISQYPLQAWSHSEDLPLLEVALSDAPEAKGADGGDCAKDEGAAGALGGEVALVLDRRESAGGRHVPVGEQGGRGRDRRERGRDGQFARSLEAAGGTRQRAGRYTRTGSMVRPTSCSVRLWGERDGGRENRLGPARRPVGGHS